MVKEAAGFANCYSRRGAGVRFFWHFALYYAFRSKAPSRRVCQIVTL
ncbi:Hypothetical protein SMB2099_3868 [Serratia marcescens SMB2099]|nr:Hypothetical protein SMB2099_3868 [Serratia marcescens SMB2099]